MAGLHGRSGILRTTAAADQGARMLRGRSRVLETTPAARPKSRMRRVL